MITNNIKNQEKVNNMDYEKKYKKAYERARELVSQCRNDRDRRTKIYRVEDIESIFSEIKYSNDEKYIICNLSNHQVQDILDELGMIDDNGYCPYTAEEIFKSALEYFVLHYVKINEQEWSIEDEENINRLIKICEKLECLKDWLKSLRSKKQEENKNAKILNADKVIEWLKHYDNVVENLTDKFKHDFSL